MSDSDGGEMLLVLIGAIFIGIGLALWWIHRLIAWSVLFLVRDALVYLFGDDLFAGTEELLVVIWRIVMPLVLFGIGFWLIFCQFAEPDRYIPWVLNLPLSATAGGLLVYHYGRLYGQHPPRHYTWARFLAAEVKLRSEAKLAWIEETFRWKL